MTDERRRYFRIEDDFEVRFRVLPQRESSRPTRIQTTIRESVDELRNKSRLVLNRLKISHKDVAELLELQELRLRRIEDLVPDGPEFGAAPTAEDHAGVGVNISACGVAFRTGYSVPPESRLRVTMTLQPDDLRVTTTGIVVSCARPNTVRTEENPFLVQVDFRGMHPDAEELLVQHILKRQSALIRARRDEADR